MNKKETKKEEIKFIEWNYHLLLFHIITFPLLHVQTYTIHNQLHHGWMLNSSRRVEVQQNRMHLECSHPDADMEMEKAQGHWLALVHNIALQWKYMQLCHLHSLYKEDILLIIAFLININFYSS